MSVHRTYSTTSLLTPAYSLGFCAAMSLILQVCSGLLLSTDYNALSAFESCGTHLRDLDGGWLTRSVHAVGASLFMLMLYLHMGRCLWYASPSSRSAVWTLGVVIYLLVAGACFTGYSLINGQMSLWAIVVISNLAAALLGPGVLDYLWGGSVVSSATFSRFFSAHYLLPLVIVAVMLAHVLVLHAMGSTGDQTLVSPRADTVNLAPVMLVRDLAVYSLLVCYGALVLGWYPEVFGHPDNWVKGDPLVTPAMIAPEWYLLPCYGVLRAVPSKSLGVIAMALVLLNLLPIGYGIRRGWSVQHVARWCYSTLLVDSVAASVLCLQCNSVDLLYGALVTCVLSLLSSCLLSVVRVVSGVQHWSPTIHSYKLSKRTLYLRWCSRELATMKRWVKRLYKADMVVAPAPSIVGPERRGSLRIRHRLAVKVGVVATRACRPVVRVARKRKRKAKKPTHPSKGK